MCSSSHFLSCARDNVLVWQQHNSFRHKAIEQNCWRGTAGKKHNFISPNCVSLLDPVRMDGSILSCVIMAADEI